MNQLNRRVTILTACAGCLLIGLYFWLAANLPVAGILKPSVTQAEVIEQAQTIYDRSELYEYVLTREVQVELDKNLLTYAQTHLANRLPDGFYPVASWNVTWSGQIQTKKEGPQPASLSVKYDFSGKLIEMLQDYPDLQRPPNYKESEALQAAQDFLTDLYIDDLSLSNKVISRDSRVLTYDFIFSKPSAIARELRETYEVRIMGRNVAYYRGRITFDPEVIILPESYKTSETVSLVSAGIIWSILCCLVIISFIKRLRRDLLEFKRAFWIGFAACFLVWPALALAGWPDANIVLLAGGLAGLLTGVGLLLVYAVTDSIARDIFPEQLALTDLVCRGICRVRELGQAMLHALAFAGPVLITVVGLYWLTSFFDDLYLNFDGEALLPFHGTRFLSSALLKETADALFITLLFFVFTAAYLRPKLRSQFWFTLVFALLINLAGLHLYHIQPTYVAFVLFLPAALVVSYLMLRTDPLAVFLGLLTVFFMHELVLLGHLPGSKISLPLLTALAWITLLLGAGCALIFSPRSTSDYRNYVPSYFSRIAERERLLKELEIARTVQKRFLPQQIPSLPNLDISCICQPAMEVGGDYYDFVQNNNGSIAVIIGDVSGKGVSAAFYMTMAKGIIKTIAKSISCPSEVLSKMNAVFYENVPKDVFISVIYGEFDLRKKVLTYARAGHNPLIVYKGGKRTAELVTPKGLAIGLDSGALFDSTIEQVEIPLEKDDLFVFYTDGISESLNNNGEEFGEKRLKEVITQNNTDSAKKLNEKIHSAIRTFAGDTKQHDDLTMVTIRVKDI